MKNIVLIEDPIFSVHEKKSNSTRIIIQLKLLLRTRCTIITYTLYYYYVHSAILLRTHCNIIRYTLQYYYVHTAILLPTHCNIITYTLHDCPKKNCSKYINPSFLCSAQIINLVGIRNASWPVQQI